MLPIYKSILAMRDIAPVIWDTDIKVFALGKLLGLGRWEVGGGLYMGYYRVGTKNYRSKSRISYK